MLVTNKNTVVVSSTDLKRHYREVKKNLDNQMIVIITNRNNQDTADGIFIPYSRQMIEKLEDLMEDMEIENNKKTLEKKFEMSYNSNHKKRIKLKDA